MKRASQVAGWLLGIGASLGFLVFTLRALRPEDLRPHLSSRFAAALALAALACACTVPLGALAWRRLLAAMGVKAAFRRLHETMMLTQIAKYLPGNVAHFAGRLGLAIRHGLPAPPVIASFLYEAALLLLSGALAAGAGALFSRPGRLLLQTTGTTLVTAILAALGLLLVLPHAGRLVAAMVERLAVHRRAAAWPTSRPRPRDLGWAMLCYLGANVAVGAGAAVLVLGLNLDPRPDVALLTGAFAAAWVVGFVTPGAPAGLGVREVLLSLVIGPSLGAAATALLVLALRVATVLADLLCFAAGLLLSGPLRRVDPGSARGRP